MVKKFQNNEHGYLAWIEQHPHGFAVNTTKKFSFCKIHRATCSYISTYTLNGPRKPGGFTERQYIKLCSSNPKVLERVGGSPYLEVHHKKFLARGGVDTVKNARALCPNCHRKVHYEMNGSPA
ncbi:MAG TPA: HNH endonuclease [Hyalangium sp.]|nr:HNH endonuclease [Hyalangium sp.]